MKTIGYQQRCVAFLDLWGFKNLVERSETDPALLRDLIEVFRAINWSLEGSSAPNPYLAHSFSDSVILSAGVGDLDVMLLLNKIKELCFGVLSVGALPRGGVTIGSLHHDRTVAFGRGLHEAHELESRVAYYPRILLSEPLVERVRDISKTRGGTPFPVAYIRCDPSDGRHHLDYLLPGSIAGQATYTRHYMERRRAFVVRARERLIDRMKNASDDRDRERFVWFRGYFNEALVRQQELHVDLLPEET